MVKKWWELLKQKIYNLDENRFVNFYVKLYIKINWIKLKKKKKKKKKSKQTAYEFTALSTSCFVQISGPFSSILWVGVGQLGHNNDFPVFLKNWVWILYSVY